MDCNHERLRCTNNRFICVLCGQDITDDVLSDKWPYDKEKPVEVAKKPRKRNVKKEVE